MTSHITPRDLPVSAAPIYGVGRERAIPALHLREGSRVLDIGCGTGLNFPRLLAAVGRSGQVVGVDHSGEMLEVARRKTIKCHRTGRPPARHPTRCSSPSRCR
ncbi:class I SAM-dependent methyltransferase [Lapillicoccus sp.]|uniref:class I SAM-dependent methyltransferase n=1 Tax=Lapillicoccus sp. TaxID=1909287 RepID=UPI003983695C